MAFNFEDTKELVVNSVKNAWEEFQESSFYQNGRDRFENLTPPVQKLVLLGTVLLLTLLIFALPWSSYSTSSDSVSQFEEKRNLIRDLLKVSRDANESSDIPVPPSMESLKSRVQTTLQTAQLLPEQVKMVEVTGDRSSLIPSALINGILTVRLEKLNLRQIVDLGYQLQTISPSVKMKDLTIDANLQNTKYFDVVYKLAALNVPEAPVSTPDNEEPARGKKGSRPSPGSKKNRDRENSEDK